MCCLLHWRSGEVGPPVDLLVVEVIEDDVSMDASPHVLVVDLRLLEVGREGHVESQVDRGLGLVQLKPEVPLTPQSEGTGDFSSHFSFFRFIFLECNV